MASEDYVYVNYPQLDIPFTVITGTEEDMELADIHSWQSETNSVIDFRQIPGKHFFIFKYPLAIVDILCEKLSVHPKLINHE